MIIMLKHFKSVMCGYGGLQTRDIGKTFEAVELQRITEAKTLSKTRSLSSSCSCLQEECTVDLVHSAWRPRRPRRSPNSYVDVWRTDDQPQPRSDDGLFNTNSNYATATQPPANFIFSSIALIGFFFFQRFNETSA